LEKCGGGKRVRTADPLLAGQVLYQLSYAPTPCNKQLTYNNKFQKKCQRFLCNFSKKFFDFLQQVEKLLFLRQKYDFLRFY
jgi:hypothetical protein